jgi:hypothetical protein
MRPDPRLPVGGLPASHSGAILRWLAAAICAVVPLWWLLSDGDGRPRTTDVYPGESIQEAISSATPGARIVVHGGRYPVQRLDKAFDRAVTVQAARGERVRMDGFILTPPASNIVLRGFLIEPPDGAVGLQVRSGISRIVVSECRITGGQFGIRFAGGDPPFWPRDVLVHKSEVSGAEVDNVQIDGATNATFTRNWIHDPQVNGRHNDGIQSLASEGLRISGNVFSFRTRGPNGPNQAIILGRADPPVDGRLVTHSEIVNNLIARWWGAGITLAGTGSTTVVNNTVADSGLYGRDASLVLSAKHDPATFANTDLHVRNNIFYRVRVVAGAVRPAVDSHNLVQVGGAGTSLIRASPRFADRRTYHLTSKSPAVGTAAARYAPRVDLWGGVRGERPDRGAIQFRAWRCGSAADPAPGPALIRRRC